MADDGAYPAKTRSVKPLPAIVPARPPATEKRLDAALLAVIRRRKLEQSVLPGVPFH